MNRKYLLKNETENVKKEGNGYSKNKNFLL